jgi:hypothetical protein
MTDTRKWRIVRDVLKVSMITSAIAFAFYVMGYCVHNWKRAVTVANYQRHDWLFYPLDSYAGSNLPGSETFHTLNNWLQYGGVVTWEESGIHPREYRAQMRQRTR